MWGQKRWENHRDDILFLKGGLGSQLGLFVGRSFVMCVFLEPKCKRKKEMEGERKIEIERNRKKESDFM